ncbi:MAG: hypothetical protein LKF64_06310 [Alcaligenes faecalis]|uniref:hypothetical protein n=1 Tax=Alcaligenes aquatilis TaxID=323284 RepID=UPI000D52AE34|nr:hypothetical protein [Alcaligenes aquatilis]AWG36575.1 hypothetical protein CA948_16305 [Alcaligenes aquatilis]MCH4224591.1 hypothetical protein [Alcaligenes faecalis]
MLIGDETSIKSALGQDTLVLALEFGAGKEGFFQTLEEISLIQNEFVCLNMAAGCRVLEDDSDAVQKVGKYQAWRRIKVKNLGVAQVFLSVQRVVLRLAPG